MTKTNNELLENARRLRREMTKQEKHLWYDFLQHYPVKIYKQKVIDNFIADFYCHKARLIIEIDGSQHYTDTGKSYDEKRTNILKRYDLSVMRFSNLDVDRNFKGVCIAIDNAIKDTLSKPSDSYIEG